jgi:outer membrane protein assembly factor BamB
MRRCFAALLVGLTVLSAVHADNWPQWRGPTYDGISKETGLPAEWSPTKNIAWKVKMPGRGGATPCVWGDRLFLTSEDGKDLVVLCVSADGKELWKRKVGSGAFSARGGEGDAASPSPSTDGKHVFAMFGTGDMACFDFDGKEVWKFNAQERYGRFRYAFGMHSTPVLFGDRLYLQLIHTKPGLVIALDKATGEDVWKVERPSDGYDECYHSYASATIWTNGKDAVLVTHGNDYTVGHNLKDGSEIWRIADLNPKAKYNNTLRFVASPVTTPDMIVAPTAKGGPVVAITPDASGRILPGNKSELWRYRRTPDVPSPLVHDGLVYLCMADGQLACLDAKTGKEHYSKRAGIGDHRASPVYADGKLYIISRAGVVNVVKAGTNFEPLATNKMEDQTTASLAIANGRIYMRCWDTLYAISTNGK